MQQKLFGVLTSVDFHACSNISSGASGVSIKCAVCSHLMPKARRERSNAFFTLQTHLLALSYASAAMVPANLSSCLCVLRSNNNG